jgi:ATP-dependent Lhr-like helicase
MGEKRRETLDFIHKFLYVDENSANSLYEYVNEQKQYATVPTDELILVEFYRGFKGEKYVIFHTIFGRRVNDALSRAVAYVVSKRTHRDVMISLSDNGFYLSAGEDKLQSLQALSDLRGLELRTLLVKAIDRTEVLVRRFRHCAARSLMILRSYKGRKKSVGRQQIGSKLLLSFVKKLPGEFPILKEARREVLEDLMDVENASKVLDGIRSGKIKVETVSTDIPSPFALNLIAQGYMDYMKMEDRLEFIKRMHQATLLRIRRKEAEHPMSDSA